VILTVDCYYDSTSLLLHQSKLLLPPLFPWEHPDLWHYQKVFN